MKIGFIGLGNMGSAKGCNLIKAGTRDSLQPNAKSR